MMNKVNNISKPEDESEVVTQNSTDCTRVGNEQFYENAKEYWSHLPPTENAVLGGFGHISQIDIQGSRNFLQQIFRTNSALTKSRALDCGAGIGRVSQCLLTTFYEKVDLVEQNPDFLNEARKKLAGKIDKIGEYFSVGLQEFNPAHKYDLIWCQWVLGHLTDEDLVQFLKRCKDALTPNGFIVIKENMSSSGDVELDGIDSSYTRTYSAYIEIFEQCQLKCFKKQKQMHFPKELYAVFMFGLQPC